ncbi:trans-sialidase, putative [Trypanosoma cruzi marinkellei]|uniref:Trans-sialidase, putative n=1 Tax=Trypanosoma cruzi marinkellei TaxID=85056 RepID=K2MNT5_TRYCR|nr:trans-sialidase, putative [Trypanosoma cruzi marinkellei]
MHSRVAVVKASGTHNRRRVTGSSGRRREGRESERQRPNMSRHHFYSAVLLLLLFVVMMCCGSGSAETETQQSSVPKFNWKGITEGEGVTVKSLDVPGLLKVGNDVFAVAEALCTENSNDGFTGVASQLLTMKTGKEPEEVLKNAKGTQVLNESTSTEEKRVDVSRPTTVVNGTNIYMLVGTYSHEDATTCKSTTEKTKSGLLLVKCQVGDAVKKIHFEDTDGLPCTLGDQHDSLKRLIGGGGSGVKMNDGTFLFPVEGTKKEGDAGKDGKTVSLIIHSKDT